MTPQAPIPGGGNTQEAARLRGLLLEVGMLIQGAGHDRTCLLALPSSSRWAWRRTTGWWPAAACTCWRAKALRAITLEAGAIPVARAVVRPR